MGRYRLRFQIVGYGYVIMIYLKYLAVHNLQRVISKRLLKMGIFAYIR